LGFPRIWGKRRNPVVGNALLASLDILYLVLVTVHMEPDEKSKRPTGSAVLASRSSIGSRCWLATCQLVQTLPYGSLHPGA